MFQKFFRGINRHVFRLERGLLDAGGPHRQDRDQKRCAVKNQSSAILSSTRPFPGGICITAGGIVVVYQA
jgi:hypothetical protein